MTQQHPISQPPYKLVQQWCTNAPKIPVDYAEFIAAQAARWGADQELEACCAIAISDPVCGTKHQRNMLVRHIREQRRPKPPSLKEQATFAAAVLQSPDETCSIAEIAQHWHTIRHALEALPDD